MRNGAMRPFVACLGVLGVTACAGPIPSSIPVSTQADAARVRFVNRVESGWMELYPPTECNNGIRILEDSSTSRVLKSVGQEKPPRLGMLGTESFGEDRNVAEYAFEPLKIVNVGLGGSRFSQGCWGGLSFQVAAHAQYEVRFTGEGESCRARVFILYEEQGAIARQPFNGVGRLVCR
jgi:hypothetical protein